MATSGNGPQLDARNLFKCIWSMMILCFVPFMFFYAFVCNAVILAILVSVQDSVYCAWLTWFVYFLFCPSLEHAKQLCLPPRNIPGAQICMIDFASCDQTVAYEPYKDRYVACRRHSYVDQVTGEAKGVCFVAKWYQDSWGEWKEAQPAVACAAIEYYGKGIVAQTIQNKINDNVKRCKDALCKVVPQFAIHSNHSTFINNSFNNHSTIIHISSHIYHQLNSIAIRFLVFSFPLQATSGKWATSTKSAAKKAWPESTWKPGTWGWAKTAEKFCETWWASHHSINISHNKCINISWLS